MTKTTTITIVSLLFIGMVSVIMYHQLNAQEIVTIEPTYIQEEVLYEPPSLDTTPEYDVIQPSVDVHKTFEQAFAESRFNYGNDSTFFWNGNEYHSRTFEEELERIHNLTLEIREQLLKEEFVIALQNSLIKDTIKIQSVVTDSIK